MATERVGGPVPRTDGISDPVPGAGATPLPPHIDSLLTDVSTAIATMVGLIDGAITDTLNSADEQVDQLVADIGLAYGALFGLIDTELIAVEIPAHSSVDKLLVTNLGNVLYQEAELTTIGVYVPFPTDEMDVILDDPSGQPVLDALIGRPPSETRPAEYGPVAPGVGPIIDDGIYAPITPVEPPYDIPPPSQFGPVAPTPTEPSTAPPADDSAPPVSPGAPAPPVSPVDDGDCGCPAPVINLSCPPVTVVMPAPAPAAPAEPDEPDEDYTPPDEDYEPPLPPPPAPPLAFFLPVPESPPLAPPPPSEAWEPIPIPPPVTYAYPGIRWDLPTVCRDASESIHRMGQSEAVRNAGVSPEGSTGIVNTYYRAATATVHGMAEFITSGFDSQQADNALVQHYRSTGDILGGTTQARDSIEFLPESMVNNKAVTWTLGFMLGTAAKGQESSGIPVDIVTKPLRQLLQYMYPHELPAQGSIDHLRQTGLIDAGRWACLTKALGNNPTLADMVWQSNVVVPTPAEIQHLANRGSISEDARQRMLALQGFTGPTERQWQKDLSEFIPGATDLVRFMVRDSFDPAVIAEGQLDKDFALKFYGPGGKAAPGPAARWAAAQGMDESQFRYYWYAHWEYPSNTQLYEMLHRLRPDRPEVIASRVQHEQWKLLGGRGAEPEIAPVVTRADVRRVLEINDIAPQWIDPLISISYHPVTRTDAIDAYHAGAFDDGQLHTAMLDNGYSAADADRLVKIQQVKRGRRLSNLGALPSIRAILKDYEHGVIDGMEAQRRLTPLVVDPGQRQMMLAAAEDRVTATTRRAIMTRAKRAYIVGEVDAQHVRDHLLKVGVANGRIADIVAQWTEDKQGRYKEPTAKLIVQWAQIGLILPDDAYNRVFALGYNKIDATRIVYQGIYARNELIQGKIDKRKKEVRQMVKDQKQAGRENEKALKDRQKEIEKQQKALEVEQQRIQKELDSRAPAPLP